MNRMPTVATHDLVIHPRERDLVIATHGRSLYIIDDMRPLQDLTPAVREKKAHLFPIADASLDGGEGDPSGSRMRVDQDHGSSSATSLPSATSATRRMISTCSCGEPRLSSPRTTST